MKRFIVVLTILILAIGGAFALAKLTDKNTPQKAAVERGNSHSQPGIQTLSTDKILSLVNKARLQNHIAPLIKLKYLESSATEKCKDMQKYQYYAHVNSNTGVRGISILLKHLGTTQVNADENLAKGSFTSNEQLVNGWLKSPAHRKAILNADYVWTGVAVCDSSPYDADTLAVEHFASRY